ncbi:MAG: RDD family protein [Burkholderiales bacterium]|nr:RDD family protein [Burkholderiales bacterium]
MESEVVAFSRSHLRLRAAQIDFALFFALLALTGLALDVLSTSNATNHYVLVGFLIVAGFYEPIMVAFRGATIGHQLANIHVVSVRTGRKVNILTAIFRFLIKSLLGWFSYLSMFISRRNEAVHDGMTRSCVLIKDLSKANTNQYTLGPLMPTFDSRQDNNLNLPH